MLPRRKVPPGLPNTLRRGAVNLSPVAVVLLLGRLMRVLFDFKLPAIVVALAAIASVPAFYMLRLVAHRRRVRRAAKRAGAVLPPEWNGEKFGNRDLLVRAIDRFQNGYIGGCCVMSFPPCALLIPSIPGDGFWDKIDELGHLHAITIYGDTAYITNDANVVKVTLT